MLRNAKGLQGYTIHATDGDIGHVEQFYFDDAHWVIRYLVAATGNWLTGRSVLIANYSIGAVEWDEHRIFVTLTREQVENAPGTEEHRPLTRQYEAHLLNYYGFPYYWSGEALLGVSIYPTLLLPAPAVEEEEQGEAEESEEDSHLQSTLDVTGFQIEAADGEIGHVGDFILDDETWTIRYLEVDTRNWWPGKKVLVAPRWIEDIDWRNGQVRIDLLREVIKNAPEYDPSAPLTRQYEIELYDYYGEHLSDYSGFRYWTPR